MIPVYDDPKENQEYIKNFFIGFGEEDVFQYMMEHGEKKELLAKFLEHGEEKEVVAQLIEKKGGTSILEQLVESGLSPKEIQEFLNRSKKE